MSDGAGNGWISAHWPVPAGVRALTTTRGLPSPTPKDAVKAPKNDDADHSAAVRQTGRAARRAETLADSPDHLRAATVGEAGHLQWLTQVHGKRCIRADLGTSTTAPEADAAWTSTPNLGLVIKTADCVPVVIARRDGSSIGVAHGGWRGLVGGVVEQLIAAMQDREAEPEGRPRAVSGGLSSDELDRFIAGQDQQGGQVAHRPPRPRGSDLVAWIGPAIGPEAYEVGEDVRSPVLAITGRLAGSTLLERSKQPGKWFLDLFAFTDWLLRRAGVEQISCQRICTYSNPNLHSYRRDGSAAGRLATVVWKTP